MIILNYIRLKSCSGVMYLISGDYHVHFLLFHEESAKGMTNTLNFPFYYGA